MRWGNLRIPPAFSAREGLPLISLHSDNILNDMIATLLLIMVSFEPSVDSVGSAWLDTAFRYLNITKRDLAYPRIWSEDTMFLLGIPRHLLQNPLEVPYTTDSIENSVVSLADRPESLLMYLSTMLDSKGICDIEFDVGEVTLPRDLPQSLRPQLIELLEGVERARATGEMAFRDLTAGEIDTLMSDAIYWWTDEDDTLDDTLRGLLNREMGLPAPFAYGDTTSIQPKSLKDILRKIDVGYLMCGEIELLKAVSNFLSEIQPVDSEFQIEFDSGVGRVCIGGTGENHYHDCDLVVDFGGNDFYSGRCGGGVWNGRVGAGIVLDFGGDDFYKADRVVSLGAGLLGYGLLMDMGGNDVYTASHVSMGAGLIGCGVLIDMGGCDSYQGGFFVEGSGNFGVGVLDDRDGDDSYRAYDFAQGMGGVEGIGLILDEAGNDTYYAGGKYIHHPLRPQNYRSFAQGFAIGWRPDFPGGIGLLFDLHGNDSYYSEIYGQGVSYWLSFAALVDDEGDDSYYGIQYMQGAGIHLSTGILIDRGGDDAYFSRYGPSQGEGHDLSVGWLIDRAGNDRYFVSDGQGIGLTNSVGFFMDFRGNDVYGIERYGEGWGNMARNTPGIGVFLDLGGDDRYPAHLKGENGKIWLGGTYGIGIDAK